MGKSTILNYVLLNRSSLHVHVIGEGGGGGEKKIFLKIKKSVPCFFIESNFKGFFKKYVF